MEIALHNIRMQTKTHNKGGNTMIKTEQIIATYAMQHDLHDLLYKLQTGRLWKDYEIIQLFRAKNASDFYSSVTNFKLMMPSEFPTFEELEKAGWITYTSKKIVKKIVKLANIKTLVLS